MTKENNHSLKNNGPSGALDRLLDTLVPARQEARRLAQRQDRLEAFLTSVPIEYCGWDPNGIQAMSAGFCTLLDIAKASSLQDVQAGLLPGDAAALEGLYTRLQQNGENFNLGVRTASGTRSLKLVGKRGMIREGSAPFSVIWVLDVTDFAEAAVRSLETVKAAEQRENSLLSALHALPFPIWIRNQELNLSWCNKTYAKIVEDTAAAIIAGQKELPMTGPGKAELTQRILAQRALAKNEAQTMRGHTVVDGQRRLLEVMETPIAQEKKIVGVALDVTKEEEWAGAYAKLVSSQREALEQMRTAIAMFDVDTKLEFYNSAYEELTGMSGTWLDAKPKITEIIDKMRELRKLPEQADYKQFRQQWLNRFTSLLEPYEEMQYLPDGTVVRMIVVPRPMGGLLLTLEDVTSHLQLETSYNTLMAVQKETMDNLSEGIAVFGEDGRLRLSNLSFGKIWAIQPEELTGLPHITQISEKTKSFFDDSQWVDAKQVIMTNALEREPRKGRIHRSNGTVLEYAVVPLPDGNILNAWFDVTDTVKVEESLMGKNAALEEAEKLKTDFLANVSYQLRTPLNAIMGFAEMLNQQYFGKLNERQLEYTSNMIEAGQRLVSLVNDILDLSTIEAGYLRLYPAGIRVKTLIEQVMTLTEAWARKQKINIVLNCPDDSLMLVADERRLKQVLLNLISNALNYSPNGGKIAISAQKDKDFLVLQIEDNGIGIPAEELERVFTPFEKIRSGKTQRRSGAGLGLALVQSIIHLHGGTVSIASTEGVGTTVTCRLPLKGPVLQEK